MSNKRLATSAVQYLGPQLEKVDELDLTFIEDLIRNAGPSYWLAGSATGELLFETQDGARSPQLVLMVQEPYGVLLRYCPPGGLDEYVLTDGEDSE